MTERILIDAAHPEEVRVILANDQRLEEFEFEAENKKQIKSNIYLGKITRVEPSLQAAFVEYGGNRQGFLPFAEVHFDYYQIPIADKEKLLEAVAREAEAATVAKQAPVAQAVVSLTPEEMTGDAASPEAAVAAPEGEAAEKPARKRRGRKPKAEGAEAENAHDAVESVTDTEQLADYTPEALLAAVAQVPSDVDAEAIRQAEELARAFAAEEGYELPEELRGTGEEIIAEAMATESYGDDQDDMAEVRAYRSRFYRQYKIQEVLKRNQIVLVQVIKEERGSKGASLTTYISLPGRYCVLMPNTERAGGVSRRISNPEDRQKLKEVISNLEVPKGMSVIMRTAGVGHEAGDIQKDYDYLRTLWDDIRKRTMESTAPSLVYEEGSLIKRSLRDLFRDHVSEVVVEGQRGYEVAREFVELMAPERVEHVREHNSPVPIFKQFHMESQLDELYANTARLPSGGSLVLNATEALVAIDVNSGRSTRERSIEDTALRTNLEAAAEVARQLRLRDLAGLVVIDFIDMRDIRNRRAVERALKDALKADRAKIQVGRISMFGLLEMSRQRLHSSIVEATSTQCSHCKGTGFVRSEKSNAVSLLRVIEAEAARDDVEEIQLRVAMPMALVLLNSKRREILEIETEHQVSVTVKADPGLSGAEYALEKRRGRNRGRGDDREVSHEHQGREHRQERGEGREDRGERGDRGDRRNRHDRGDRRNRDRDRDRGQRQPYETQHADVASQHDGDMPIEHADGQPEDNIGNTVGNEGREQRQERGDRRNRRNRRDRRNRGDRGEQRAGDMNQPMDNGNAGLPADDAQPEDIVAGPGNEQGGGRPPRRDRGQQRRNRRGDRYQGMEQGVGGESLPLESANDSAPDDVGGGESGEERSRLRGLWKKITQ